MGRGPVCGMITRFAGGPATAGVAGAVVGSALGTISATALEAAAAGCSATAAGAAATSDGAAGSTGVCGGRDDTPTVGGVVEIGGLVSCGAGFTGVTTPVAAPVETVAGGFTITGPEGGRDAMAGVVAAGAETICGACRGKGTIFRAAGFDAFAALAATVLPCPAEKGALLTTGRAVEAGAGDVDIGADFATGAAVGAVTGGRCTTGAPACGPRGASRCSFCC